MENNVDELAKKIWDYLCLHQELKKAECILVLGNNDLRTAKRGAELFLAGWAPLLIFSGGRGEQTPLDWKGSEAQLFAERAMAMGVPKDKILLEDKSSNTGENIQFTKELLAENNLDPRKFILVQKPYMERRTYATFKKIWPEKDALVTSPQILFEDYPTEELSREHIINIMVGDLERIELYPKRGFSIPQEIPEDIWNAYEKLIKLGYTEHSIKQ